MSEPAAVAAVLARGELRASLEALRDRLAVELDDEGRHRPGCECECGPDAADGRVLASLSKELREVLAAIDALPAAEGGSVVDELASARKARRAAPRRRKAAGGA